VRVQLAGVAEPESESGVRPRHRLHHHPRQAAPPSRITSSGVSPRR
jgi:hypothetical protein